MDYLFTFSIICSGSGRSCWLLRGLYLSSSLYTFQKCISGLARGRHFSLPRIHPQLALKFLSRGDSVSVVPLCLPHFTNPARVRFSPCILSGLHRLVKCCVRKDVVHIFQEPICKTVQTKNFSTVLVESPHSLTIAF